MEQEQKQMQEQKQEQDQEKPGLWTRLIGAFLFLPMLVIGAVSAGWSLLVRALKWVVLLPVRLV